MTHFSKDEINKHFLKHAVLIKDNFFLIKKPLKAFKKVYVGSITVHEAIANLIIPQGAVVYYNRHLAENSRAKAKMRCTHAYVHSIATISPTKQVKNGRSILWDSDFEYVVGTTVAPRDRSSFLTEEACASGIHFYVTLEEAEAF